MSIFRLNEDQNPDPNPGIEDISPDLINKIRDLPDGSSVFEIAPPDLANMSDGTEDGLNPSSEGSANFYENLAEKAEQGKLDALAARILDEINEDLESRAGWERTVNIAMKYLGFKIDEYRNVPFAQACAAFDSTMSTALIHFYSAARATLFPAEGPAKTQINGVPTEESEDEGERVKMFLNYFLTQMDKAYYPDSERLLLYVGLVGCAFRKVYQDPIANRPAARLVKPQNFIINNNTTDLLSSTRMAEVMWLTKKEIILRQNSGDFIEGAIPDSNDESAMEGSKIEKSVRRMEGIDTDANENKSLFKFYEVHIELDPKEVEPKKLMKNIKDARIPRPYVITICEQTRKIVSIKRNWKEGDEKYKRREYYVHYYYLPGFGIYSLGLAHLMGSNQIVLTTILRMLVDASQAATFPGGLRKRGMRLENNDKAPGPLEFVEVDGGDGPIQDSIMLMPYKEPSPTLVSLAENIKRDTASIAFTAEKEIPEVGPNTPVGTTVAMMEVVTRNQSAVMKSLYESLGYELQLLFDLFGEHLGDEPYMFAVPGKETQIMKKDFNDKVKISPVANPNTLTTTHRLVLADVLINSAHSAPDIHDMREVYKRRYEAMNVENIDQILPKPPEPEALDPVTENTLIMLGKPIQVAFFQDDESHITVHRKFVQDNTAHPEWVAQTQLHIQHHEANLIFKQMQQEQIQQGVAPFPLQPGMEEQIYKLPEIQNIMAQKDKERVMEELRQIQEQQAEIAAQTLDPNKVMMADIEQRREASYLKDEEAKLRAETESFKAQLKFESEKDKHETDREISEEKNETDLTIETMKHEAHQQPPVILE